MACTAFCLVGMRLQFGPQQLPSPFWGRGWGGCNTQREGLQGQVGRKLKKQLPPGISRHQTDTVAFLSGNL